MKRILLTMLGVLATAQMAFALPVEIPSALKNVSDSEAPAGSSTSTLSRVTFGVEGDWVDKRKLEAPDAKAEGKFYGIKLGVPVLENWDVYGSAGRTQDLEMKARVSSADVKYTFDDDFYWSAGTDLVILKLPEYNFAIFSDVKYRGLFSDMDYDSFEVNGTSRSFSDEDNPQWNEWQVALGMSAQISRVVVYGGGKYSDVRVNADVTSLGTRYDLDDAEADHNAGAFGGIMLLASNNVSLDVQGRFFDETAYSGSVNLKF